MNYSFEFIREKIKHSVLTAGNRKFCFIGFACREPISKPTLLKQLIHKAMNDQGFSSFSILKAFLFVSSERELTPIRNYWKNAFGTLYHPTTALVQPPLDGSLISGIFWIYTGAEDQVIYPEGNMAILKTNDFSMLITGSIRAQDHPGGNADLTAVFDQFKKKLSRHDFVFTETVRTWIGINNINGASNGLANYQKVNKARLDFFQKNGFNGSSTSEIFRPPYPASTGIGCLNKGIIYSAIAVKNLNQCSIVPCENNRQTPAFEYPREISRFPPCFSRSVNLIANPAEIYTFVSGTASIVGAESVFLNSPEKQTHQTLDNIEKIINEYSFDHQNISLLETNLDRISYYIIYIKRDYDFDMINAICERRLPTNALKIYVKADICRSDLLVEIEAFSYSSTNPPF